MIKKAGSQFIEQKANINKGKQQVNAVNEEDLDYAYGLETIDQLFEIIT